MLGRDWYFGVIFNIEFLSRGWDFFLRGKIRLLCFIYEFVFYCDGRSGLFWVEFLEWRFKEWMWNKGMREICVILRFYLGFKCSREVGFYN